MNANYGLKAEEIEALRPLTPDPLVKVGAHPLGALMAVHVLQADRRKLQASAAQKGTAG